MKTGTTVTRTGPALLAGQPILPLMTSTGDSLRRLVPSARAITTGSVRPWACVGTFTTATDLRVARRLGPVWMTSLHVVPMMTCMMLVLPCLLRVLMTLICLPGRLLVVRGPLLGVTTCLHMTVVRIGKNFSYGRRDLFFPNPLKCMAIPLSFFSLSVFLCIFLFPSSFSLFYFRPIDGISWTMTKPHAERFMGFDEYFTGKFRVSTVHLL